MTWWPWRRWGSRGRPLSCRWWGAWACCPPPHQAAPAGGSAGWSAHQCDPLTKIDWLSKLFIDFLSAKAYENNLQYYQNDAHYLIRPPYIPLQPIACQLVGGGGRQGPMLKCTFPLPLPIPPNAPRALVSRASPFTWDSFMYFFLYIWLKTNAHSVIYYPILRFVKIVVFFLSLYLFPKFFIYYIISPPPPLQQGKQPTDGLTNVIPSQKLIDWANFLLIFWVPKHKCTIYNISITIF